jgi:sulfur-carrier protein
MAQFLYFAWVRERIGSDGETRSVPPSVATVGEMLDWLSTRSPGHAAALADRKAIRVAVNQAFVDDFATVTDHDEIAVFPPVTGG